MTSIKHQLAEFHQQQHAEFAHADVFHLIRKRSDFLDHLLIDLWQQFGFAERADLSLIAVGGYGRREMFPLSDLDILVLCANPPDDETQAQLNALFALLWDSKLQVGASVRTQQECLEVGRAEISVATNMFEGRFLAGNEAQWNALLQRFYQPDFWAIADFFHAKMAEKEARYARYHNTSYNLEPDLKHSPGGLRDLHLLMWIMLRHYGIHRLHELAEKGILFAEEYAELQRAEAVLCRMRFGLHLQLKRYDNRLRFDRQLQLSEQLGYTGEGNQPVEAMMKAYFQATQSISQLSQLLLNHFAQTVLGNLQKNAEIHPLDRQFYVQNQRIYAVQPDVFEQQPWAILDLFLYLTAHTELTASTTVLRQLRLAVRKRHQPLSELPEARERFIRLFSQPNMVKRAIVPMHQLGVLEAYLPQWRQITGLMQFDLFHIYTVDEHIVRVMLKLESFLDPENRERHPVCCALFPKLVDRALVYLAALFHDIAKGREGDHAEEGAEEMYQFAKLHGFDEAQASFMTWLVAEHLTMSITAQRRDIHDPDIIQQFAKLVGDENALNALTCLTVADICATNETLWNSWKRSLFAQLHQFTQQQLELGENKQLDTQQVALFHRLQASEQLKLILTANQWQTAQRFWAHCPNSYFARNNAKQLEWHLHGYLAQGTPMVLVGNPTATATEIFIHCADQMQLFARVAQLLSQKKVSIHHAQIITSAQGEVFDSLIVTEYHGSALDARRCQQIQQALQQALSTPQQHDFKPLKKPIKHQAFHRATKVRFMPQTRQDQTAFELFTLDREGLLAQMGYIFSELNLNLLSAKISTIGERVEDTFVLSTAEHRALSDTEQAQLKARILAEFRIV